MGGFLAGEIVRRHGLAGLLLPDKHLRLVDVEIRWTKPRWPARYAHTREALPGFRVDFYRSNPLLGFLLGKFTNASLTYADSALTIASLIGQWMMARKYLENWIIWIVADAAYVVVYFYKDLHLTAILYGIFLILAVIGFVQWRRDVGTYGQA